MMAVSSALRAKSRQREGVGVSFAYRLKIKENSGTLNFSCVYKHPSECL
jgi:hypothetical protein